MPDQISFHDAKKSKVKRLRFLPRIGLTVDFAGKQITYKHAPITETLLNTKNRGFSMKNLMDVALQQLNEISLAKSSTQSKKTKKKTSKKKSKSTSVS